MKNISMSKVLSMHVPLPPTSLQREFASLYREFRKVEGQQIAMRSEISNLLSAVLVKSFSGELTETWRDQHQAELQEAIAKRDEWLKEHGIQRSVTIPIVVEHPVTTDNVLLTRLSSTQQRVYTLVQNHPNPYFTLQTLWEGQEDEAPLERDVIERGLSMLEALGAILRISIPVSPTGEAFYQNVYRLAAGQPIEEELRALKDRFPNIRI